MAKMCDTGSLNWCGRISLLLSICGILCIMMFQIWTYYYSLVTQMDEMVLESPQVHGVLDICEGVVQRAWNIEGCQSGATTICTMAWGSENLFVDVIGNGNVTLNSTLVEITPAMACVRIMLWILPW